MKTYRYFIYLTLVVVLSCTCACSKKYDADAFGVFEAEEVMLAAQAEGMVIDFAVNQGETVKSGDCIAIIDTSHLVLQRQQIQLQIDAFWAQYDAMLAKKFKNMNDTLISIETKLYAQSYKADKKSDIDSLNDEKQQLESKITAWKKDQAKQIQVLATQVEQLYIQYRQVNEAVAKCKVVSPINGTVLSKYVNCYELAGLGRPIANIANLEDMILKVYVSEDQLSTIKLGQKCEVRIDAPDEEMEVYEGKITWISSQSEFTPKMIQTKKERVNLVYAVNIKVKNNGKIKIGMPGEVTF
ncbi:MAG: HlyD family efflux transporter periplasmic adaptor subunit [Bacteroidales bacterium]|nr:HlyD family efflux transporter periplasmic adaptor subunit [Bacteroidales bacterium]